MQDYATIFSEKNNKSTFNQVKTNKHSVAKLVVIWRNSQIYSLKINKLIQSSRVEVYFF